MTSTTFASLGLAEPLLRALAAQNFTIPTPIQEGAIPKLLAGRDLLGVAQTGTGKTAAFALPILQHLSAVSSRAQPFSPRALILAPTRELAQQIEAAIRTMAIGSRLGTAVILGGVARRPQEDRMRRGPDIVIGTPGRIRDLMSTRHLRLDAVTHFVLDEADRMLDLGFIRDIRRIVASLPAERQSLLFSATMPPAVAELAKDFLRNPERVEITPDKPTPQRIAQELHVVASAGKNALLVRLLQEKNLSRVIVFTRTKRGADRVSTHLLAAQVDAEVIHGNKSQNARERALDRFRSGRARVLVATDIAARGIDVVGVSHVINFDLPMEPESYVHRIGRTARAGADGIAISFCDYSERSAVRAIERCAGVSLWPAGFSGGETPQADRAPNPPQRQRRRARGRPGQGMRAAA